ncbi:hypothetical protein DL95DRAFT_517353 [Leptodontidium sp. 2 PMI_412]|nr:hypothetical protein DL95DRAFT_517353 [Leptodontidium sp. 2 PMI_412]
MQFLSTIVAVICLTFSATTMAAPQGFISQEKCNNAGSYGCGGSNNIVVCSTSGKFHWGFLIGPKTEKGVNVPGVRFHVKNTPTNGWVYEEKSVGDVRSTNTLLARIIIAKVEDEKRLINLLQNLPIVNGDPNWRYRSWVAQALTEIARDGKCVGTSELDWRKIEAFAREYVAKKRQLGDMGMRRIC